MSDDDTPRDTPSPVIASIALGGAPLPFLLIYSVIFISHGVFYPVQPPDITRTRGGEAVAGFLAAAIALVLILTIWWFLNRQRRWPFVLGQLAVLVATAAFVADPNTGSPTVSVVLIVTSAAALVFAMFPVSWRHVGSWAPKMPRRSRAIRVS
ncbi:MAG: hypothetical protein M3N95_03730 [Actinomycetota bacterium]|nr:hypothetical protein [Actinomycetota bacterium]